MDLNPKQLEAVNYTEGPLLILAGAGSGKTTVLSERVGHLMKEKNVRSNEILAVTFTNKAVNGLEGRIAEMLSGNAEVPMVVTFHGLGLYLLRTHFMQRFSVAHKHQARQILKTIVDDNRKIIEGKFEELDKAELTQFLRPNTLASKIASFKRELVTPQFLEEGKLLKEWVDSKKVEQLKEKYFEYAPFFPLFQWIYTKYQNALRKEKLLDVDDILLYAVAHLVQKQEVLKQLQESFRYIMVDEYQDTNQAQYVLIHLLAKGHRNLAVVGDDYQSVFAFQGSDYRNILKFREDYPDAKIVLLVENYRSTKTILSVANEVIAHNKGQHHKQLYTTREEGEKVGYIEGELQKDEAANVINEIQRLVKEEGYHYRDIAVLYRNNSESSVYETTFPNRNIPFVLAKDGSFFDRKEIKDILCYLSFLVDERDEFCFKTIINTPKRGIGPTTQTAIKQNAETSYFTICQNPGDIKVSKKAREGLTEFVRTIETGKQMDGSQSVSAIIKKIVQLSGYRREFDGLEQYLVQEKEEYIKKLCSLADEYEHEVGRVTVEEFLTYIKKTDVDSQLSDETFNRVNLSTLHSAKGLEFPVVFMVGMNEGTFPSKYAVTEKDVEEERRLCYVGITRAKTRLYFSRPLKTLISNENEEKTLSENVRSCFLSEFNNEKIQPL